LTRIIPKRRGEEEILAQTGCHVGRILTVHSEHRLCRQYPRVLDEPMRVLGGRCEMTVVQCVVVGNVETLVLDGAVRLENRHRRSGSIAP
jgi:hypothetical protein